MMKRAIIISFLLLSSFTSYALDIDISSGNSKADEVIKNTLAYKRLLKLKDSEGALFWMRRLNREAKINLQSLGYYEASIETEFSNNKDRINIQVLPGLPVQVSSILIKTPQAALDKFPFPLKKESQLDHRKYEQGKQQLHAWLLANGYLNAKLITHRVEVTRKNKTAEIILEWDTGPQYQFGDVSFEDNKLSPLFLKRYIPFQHGDTFSEAQLQKFSEQLRSSNYFSSVDIIPQLDNAIDLKVPILVRLQPLNSTVFELGLSVGTDQGAGLEADITKRRANPKGHNWRIQSELTTQRFLIGGRYAIPSGRQLDRISRINLTYVDELTDTSDRQTVKGTVSQQRLMGKWQRTDAISFLDEKFIIADIQERSNFLIGSVDLARTDAIDKINPVSGWRASATLSAATDALGSSTNFVRTDLDYKRIGSFNEKSRWLVRTRLGALWVDDFQELPSSLRFFAGGDRSVRGFDFEELGPTDTDNNVLGGQYLATASLELDYLLKPKWRVASFIDTGNAFGAGDEVLEYSAGIGVRWLSPIGPVRLDFANALSEPDKPWRLHFSIGPDL